MYRESKQSSQARPLALKARQGERDVEREIVNIEHVHDASVWTSEGIGGKAGLVHPIREEHAAALAELLEHSRERRLESLSRADFDHPVINELMAGVRGALFEGRGAAILSAVDLSRFSISEFSRICWGLGTHLGVAAPQSYRRDRLGYVQKEQNNPTARGYLMDVELRSHTDFHEVLCLACVRRAASGGGSGLVSAMAVHNALLESRPDLMPVLYEGYYGEWAGEQAISSEKMPVFCRVDDRVSCYYHPLAFLNAAKARGEPLPEALAEAMKHFSAVADGAQLRANFMLEPGEIVFWHNFLVLHSRRAFQNAGSDQRLLLRLWLNIAQGRRMHPTFTARARAMDHEHEKGRPAIDYTKYGPFKPRG